MITGVFAVSHRVAPNEQMAVDHTLTLPPKSRLTYCGTMTSASPYQLFDQWFAEAQASEPNDPNAMALATVDADGRPSVRMVLLKGHDDAGFVFYTNLESRKGLALAANPQAALLFHWKSLTRQIRIEGAVEPVSEAEADAYFASPAQPRPFPETRRRIWRALCRWRCAASAALVGLPDRARSLRILAGSGLPAA
jgi:hypothetical protein